MSTLADGKILVTGGAGFIGSALIWALNQRGVENILVSDRLATDLKWRNLVGLRFNDYVDADDLLDQVLDDTPTLNEIRTVFHLGACSATTELDAGYLMQNNFEYTKFLCGWALRHRMRFVYASSAATYGDGAQGMDDDETQLDRLRPLNAYGYSKHLFDLHARQNGYLRQIVGLKYFNVFGPNEAHKGEMRSLVHKAFAQVQERGAIQLFRSYRPEYRDGEQKRDFLYVKDAVEMTLHLAQARGANGLYNLGSGVARSWIDLASALFEAMNRPVQVEFIEMPEVLRDKYQYFTQANVHRLRKSGYPGARFTLEAAVADYVQAYLLPGRTLGSHS
ncbi:MAG TPA: ADP-glyceromanno-heptose 6-epimerase [Chthoniobacterales bacterium]